MKNLQELIKTRVTDLEPSQVTDKAIVYTFDEIPEIRRTRVVFLEKTVIFSRENLIRGINKHSKAEYTRWNAEVKNYFSLKQEKNGVPFLQVYSPTKIRDKKYKVIRNTTPVSLKGLINGVGGNIPPYDILLLGLLRINAILTETEIPETKDQQLRKLVSLAYPPAVFFENIDIEKMTRSISNSSSLWRGNTDIKEYIRNNYGVKAIRKDMVKAVVNSSTPEALQTLPLFKNVVPVDWMIMILRNPEKFGLGRLNVSYYHNTNHLPLRSVMKTFFKMLTTAQKKKLFLTEQTIDPYFLKDTITMMEGIGLTAVKNELPNLNLSSWRALHDSLVEVQQNRDCKDQKVPQSGVTKRLDTTTFTLGEEQYEIRSPKTTKELFYWGREMGNCIGSYGPRVATGATKVFAIYGKKGLVANLEYNRGRIVQLVEKFNQPVSPEMKQAVAKELEKAEENKSPFEGIAENYFN